MRAVLVIACVSVFGLVTATEPVSMSDKLADLFAIDVDQVEVCINKTKVTEEDIIALDGNLTSNYNENLLQQNNTRRAVCTLICAAQAKGLMDGAKLQMAVIHEVIDSIKAPRFAKIGLHHIANLCHTEVKELNDECEVGLKFAVCVFLEGSLQGI